MSWLDLSSFRRERQGNEDKFFGAGQPSQELVNVRVLLAAFLASSIYRSYTIMDIAGSPASSIWTCRLSGARRRPFSGSLCRRTGET